MTMLLAIDPGIAATGWAVLEAARRGDAPPRLIEYGVIRPDSEARGHDRFASLAHKAHCQTDAWHGDVVIEVATDVRTQSKRDLSRLAVMWMGHGAVIGGVCALGLRCVCVEAAAWKKGLLGASNAGKHETRATVEGMYPHLRDGKRVPNDAIDAIGLGVWASLRVGKAQEAT